MLLKLNYYSVYYLVKACGQIEPKKCPEPQKTPLLDFFSRLVRHAPARPRVAHILARLPPHLGRMQKTTVVCTSHTCALTHTHSRVRCPRGIERLFRQKRRFSGLSALEPTLGLLLVFSTSRRGIKDPAFGKVANNPFLASGKSLWPD